MTNTYFILCNKVLRELFQEEASSFSDLSDTTEGVLVKQRINDLNNQIILQEKKDWVFRERMQYLYTVDGQQEYDCPDGYIIGIRPTIYPAPLIYEPNWMSLPAGNGRPVRYWIYNDKINVFPTPSSENDGFEFKVYYLTNNCAIDVDGFEKSDLEDETDESIIPDKYRDLLVWGVCRDWKRSKGDPMVEHYDNKFKEVYRSLLSSSERTDDNPSGFDMLGNTPSVLQTSLDVFYNPRTVGK